MGKCPSCGDWNTFVEEVIQRDTDKKTPWKSVNSRSLQRANKPISIQQVEYVKEKRLVVCDQELNRVLGGGIVAGSLVLIGGEPGIGKSTLMLQLALEMQAIKVLYVSGEESMHQIRMRAERMKSSSKNCFLLTETNTQNIFKQIEQLEPSLVIIDSIQTLYTAHLESAAGSISQIRESASEFMKYAKESDTSVFLIGHINKEGLLAGPKALEHMVDTVLQFEGDRHLTYRILRTIKNRFGSTSELGIYEMRGDGLKEVKNPSEILISQKDQNLSGTAIGAMQEGNRPLLIEVQSLVSPAAYGTPQRSTTGFDSKRLNMLLAVLEKRGGFRLGAQDVFLNIAGGFRVEDPALDLAVCASIISSFEDIPISANTCFAAEVGLGGEIRAVNRLENRVGEAEKLGFEKIYVSRFALKGMGTRKFHLQIQGFARLDEVVNDLF